MAFIIGTAGHIDHGKTALVKALTGQDTDRLPEEQARGISIDLGFASLDLPDGTRAGIVDVPGHERFIRNMLAGAHGIDLVLFTLAADDGVMPQTEEHLDIVHLLGVSRAIVVITKIDLVTADRVDQAERELAAISTGTLLEHAPVVRTSIVTGAGIDDLRRAIGEAAATIAPRRTGGRFRLPVDRAFTLQGHGLVVTGTAQAGDVHRGDRVRLLPANHLLRVRSVEVHGESVEAAHQGQRVALNLSAQEAITIGRGDVLCDDSLTAITTQFDAHLHTVRLPAGGFRRGGPSSARHVAGGATAAGPPGMALEHQQRVRVHIGTAERLGRVVLFGADALGSRQAGYAQIVINAPVVAMRGDRFVLRDETGQRTIAGGLVIHPWPPRHRRTDPALLPWLERLHRGDTPAMIAGVLDATGGLAAPVSAVRDALDAEIDEGDLAGVPGLRLLVVDGEPFCVTGSHWQSIRDRLQEALSECHAAHPLAPGMDVEDARQRAAAGLNARVFRAMLERFEHDALLVREGSTIRLPSHVVRLQAGEGSLAGTLRRLLGEAPLTPPDLQHLAVASGAGPTKVAEVLRVLERERLVHRASPDIYFLREAVDRVKATLRERLPARGAVTPATLRELFQTSRKYAIPLLELLDREGLTIRIGDTRRLR